MADVKLQENNADDDALSALRHTTSHVMAQAVKRLWPEAQLAIGPSIADGFYYDFDLEYRFTDEDLAVIEKEMKKIVSAGYKLEQFDLPREEALKWAEESGGPYKREPLERDGHIRGTCRYFFDFRPVGGEIVIDRVIVYDVGPGRRGASAHIDRQAEGQGFRRHVL